MATIPRMFKLSTRTFQQYLFYGSCRFTRANYCCYSVIGNYNLKPLFPQFTTEKCSDRYYSSEKDVKNNYTQAKVESIAPDVPANKLSQRARLKQAVKDYGATIIVFHVTIALASLGLCYLAISNGVDAVSFLKFIGFSESLVSNKVAVGGSTFVIAYALHKVFAPVRMAITISAAPFIVRYLRKIKWLKPPKNPQ